VSLLRCCLARGEVCRPAAKSRLLRLYAPLLRCCLARGVANRLCGYAVQLCATTEPAQMDLGALQMLSNCA
jgi:hypothetical protein